MSQCLTFVINLPSETGRRAFMEQQLKAAGIPFEVVAAVNGKAMTPEQIAAAYDDEGTRAIQRRPMSRGEIGCALSHVSIYQEIIYRRLSAALVLEDDARLSGDFDRLIQPLAQRISQETQPTIYLLTHLVRFRKKLYQKLDRGHCLHPVVDACCAHGYLINQAAAEVMINLFSPVTYPIDAWTRIAETRRIRIFGLDPYIVGHSQYAKDSNIGADRDVIDDEFQPTGLERMGYNLRFYLYEKFVYQIWKLLVGIKKQHKQSWDSR